MSVSQPDPLLPVLCDDELFERAAAVFADIRATRNTDFVNNIWRVLANDPQLLEQTWAEVKGVLGADPRGSPRSSVIRLYISSILSAV